MRVLVLGAAGNAGNNAARCLWQAGHWTLGVDTDERMLALSDCDKTAVVEHNASHEILHLEEIRGLVDHHGIRMVWAQPDAEARWLAAHRRQIPCAVAVPPVAIVDRCQDKLDATRYLRELAPDSGPISHLENLLDHYRGAWLRLTSGAGSAGALPVRDLETAEVWTRHWARTTGAQASDWMVSQILSGKDLSWTGVYSYGELVISVAKERHSLLGASRSPAQTASTATCQEIVSRPDLNVVCEEAIRRVSGELLPHGVFMVDARENDHGVPKVTEINAGRFGTTMDMFAACGPNLLDIVCDVATLDYDGPVGRRDEHEVGATWVRNTDCVGTIVGAVRELKAAA